MLSVCIYLIIVDVAYDFYILSKKLLPRLMSRIFLPMFSFRILVLGLIFKYLMCLELIFKKCKIGVQLHVFAFEYPIFPTPFIEETVLSSLHVLGTLIKS